MRRFGVALAISVAIHEIAAGAIHTAAPDRPQPETVTLARIIRIAIRPTPRPIPVLPPRLLHVRTIEHPRSIARTRAGRSARHVALAASKAPRIAARTAGTKPVWNVAPNGATAGALVAQNGSVNGAGNGSGAAGSGEGSATGAEPCGFVTFSDPHGSAFDARTRGFYVDIRMSVHFADGSSQSLVLDYPWYYSSEAANPWSDRNLQDPNFPTRFQFPPVDKMGGEPVLVKYVIGHSTSDGMTLLKDCPTPAPTT